MPLYEYECKSCESICETLIRSEVEHQQQEESECPACGKADLRRVFSVTASPSVRGGGRLPLAGDSCGAPRCCGGGCDM